MIGIIPCVIGDSSPRPYTPPVELLPAGIEQINGKPSIKTLLDYVIEEMVIAGVEIIIMVLNRRKMDVPVRYGNGKDIGVPIMYTWQPDKAGLAAAIDTGFPLMKEVTVAAVPGLLMKANTIRRMTEHMHQSEADMVICSDREGSHFPVYCWQPSFGEILREYVAERGAPTMQEAINKARSVIKVESLKPEGLYPLYTDWSRLYTNIFSPFRDQGST